MAKKAKNQEQISSLFPKNWDQPQSPSFDDNFFKNFMIAINTSRGAQKLYYFKPWDEDQKRSIVFTINRLKEIVIDYKDKREAKTNKHVLFPSKELKIQALSVLKTFFQSNNLILDEKFDDRLQRYKDIEQKRQSNVDDRKKKLENIMANIPKNNTNFWDAYNHLFETFNQPKDEAKLKKRAEKDEASDRSEICQQIIKKTFNYFFPVVVKPTDKNHHKITADQIQVFVETIENTLNNII